MADPKDERGMLMGYAIGAPQNILKIEAAFKDEMEKALKDGFTEQEIAEAKKGWLQSRNVSRANDPELANLLSALALHDRTLDFQAQLESRVAALTAEQVNAALRKHVNTADLSFIKAGDFKKAGIAQ